jgi:hypothetical protein
LKIVDMKKKTKEMLFEMMEKINPDFNVQEAGVAPDVVSAQKATTTGMQRANQRIGTPQEFQDGFMAWLGTTGFDPVKKPLGISDAQSRVRNAMIALGYK